VIHLPTGTVTLLFTDIEGSTQLLHRLGAGYAGVLAEHRRVLRGAIAAHRGVEVDTQGDAFFVAFQGAGEAVAAARDAQRALAESPVRVRMGIHTGQPTRTEEGYVGIDVHRGARICAAGHGGQVLLSEATRALLGAEIALRDLGEHRLKDLRAPEWLFQLGGPGLEEGFPPLRTLNNTNLPAEATSLVGRTRELAELGALLERGDVRLVTLTGPGGTGKTRLALRLAAAAVERFRNGVFLVPLAALTDPGLVLPTVMQTLGASETAGEAALETLARHLGGKSVLLVLDNLEQLLGAAPEIARLLASAGSLKLVLTSRERLRIAGEHEYPVPPLAEDEGVALFAERAGAADPRFRLDGDRPTVAAICRRLDGLPLAIELAASRTRLFAPAALLARLDHRMAVLTGGARDLPERQRTLRSVIDWSHGLLDPDEQRVFAALGVFAGGWDAPAAEAVCGASLDALASLQDKSLLRREPAPGGEPRFGMLETIREYALERLDASGTRAEFEERHARHYAALADAKAEGRGRDNLVSSGWMRTSRTEWIDWLALERRNVGSAMEWFVEHADAGRTMEFLLSVWTLWLERGPIREGRDWMEKTLALPDAASSPEFPALLMVASEFPRSQGDFARARALLEPAVARFRASGDPRLASGLISLGNALSSDGAHQEGRTLLEESLALARGLGDPDRIDTAINGLTVVAFLQQDYSRMAELAEEECAGARTAGSAAQLGPSLHNLAEARRHLGQLEVAATAYAESLASSQEAGLTLMIAECLDGLADLAAAIGDISSAVQLWAAAQNLFTEMGAQQWNAEEAAAGIAKAKASLGDDAFEGAWRFGQSMSRDEAAAKGFLVAGRARSHRASTSMR